MASELASLPGLDADILSALGLIRSADPKVAGSLADAFGDLPRGEPPHRKTPLDEPLIDTLRREFDRAVTDPSQLLGTADWPIHKVRRHERAPDFDVLASLAPPHVHLRDLVLPPLSIDSCIAGFDSGEPEAVAGLLLREVAPPEVLRLFAPETPQIDAMFGLPGETRSDHHQLTIGTALRPGRFTTPTPKARHDPDAAPA